MTLIDYITDWDRRTPPRGFAVGIAQYISGPPTDSTSPFFMFTIDTTNSRIYINPARTSGSWVEVASADVLAPNSITT